MRTNYSRYPRLLATAVAAVASVAFVALAAAPAAAAAGDLVCTVSKTVTFSPGVTFTPTSQTVTFSVSYSGCTSTTGAPVTSSGFSGQTTETRSCASLPPPQSATKTLVWDDSSTSTIEYTTTGVDTGGQTIYTRSGTVTAGRFTGDSFVEVTSQNSFDALACLTTGVTSQTGTGVVTFA
ncbi:hypothetical protein EV385_1207 [Krasilnikovia cinnamomea]|uniref:Ig-like domain-containing protein n=1 Tax=Krasilnikovia cinnamomea TaxID=349313 RepID=A0A4Q7ZFE6_9ACTN|nr:hypothetical protein [Krasilnikovia cinnamomea]RZU49457.1 hypothetical protein EV385_1207 [Krasilnikovia cinnamomea]